MKLKASTAPMKSGSREASVSETSDARRGDATDLDRCGSAAQRGAG